LATDQQIRLSAAFKVSVDGAALPDDAVADLVSASVHDDVEHPSAFSFTLNNWDAQKIDMKWSDDETFKVGKEIEISMGPVGQMTSLISGEITGLELDVHVARAPQLIVRGYDRAHRLARGRHTMSFTNVTDSDLATQIAGNNGLTPEVEKTSVIHAYILQHDQTDADFLRERARRIGFETFVRAKNLVFRPRKYDGDSKVVLSQETGLLEFYPYLSTMRQAGKIELRSWDPKNKSTWIGSASSGDEGAKMGGQTAGVAAAKQAFGDACISSAVHPAGSQAEVDKQAKGRLQEMALGYITAQGGSMGRPDLRAGSLVKIEGMGKRFSGLYYLTSTTHTYSPLLGYRTTFQARRNSV
jgi:Bacteriophage probable baseplate hub protein